MFGQDKNLRIKNLVLNSGLAVLSTVVMLFLVELLTRIFMPHWAPATTHQEFWQYDELLGWRHKPNTSGSFEDVEFSVNVSINSDGLRDKEYSLGRTEDKKRLLVLGDSFGWGFGVEQEEIFSEILEEKYPDWEIINASVAGYGTDQQLLYLQHQGFRYQPDVVLLVFHLNDVKSNNNLQAHGYNKIKFELINDELVLTNRPVPAPRLSQRVRRTLVSNTYFYGKLFETLVALRNQEVLPQAAAATEGNRKTEYVLTKQLLLFLNEIAKQNEAQLVVVSVPTPHDDLKNLLRERLQTASIPYLPLDEALAKSAEPMTFERDAHWNATGHEIVAETVEDFLIELDIF